jgi:hypothetical protein
MADLVAPAQLRRALIRTARVTSANTATTGTVALSHPTGMRQCDTRDPPECRIVARMSQTDAMDATPPGRNCRTVASPIECDNATPRTSPLHRAVQGAQSGSTLVPARRQRLRRRPKRSRSITSGADVTQHGMKGRTGWKGERPVSDSAYGNQAFGEPADFRTAQMGDRIGF